MEVTLYGLGTNRSARCKWTLEEAGVAYVQIDRRELAGTDELRSSILSPRYRRQLSTAGRCSSLRPSAPTSPIVSLHANLIARPGTFARAEHDQWVAFCLSEMESWLWNSGVNHVCTARGGSHYRRASSRT